MTNSAQPLKLCPFCGGDACIHQDDDKRWTQAVCGACGAKASEAMGDMNLAATVWNRRAAKSNQAMTDSGQLLRRYGWNWTQKGVLPVLAECGEWCRYTDVSALQAERDKFEEMARSQAIADQATIDELRADNARLSEQVRVAREWRPIETAPKDKTIIWLSNGASMYIGYWGYERDEINGERWVDHFRSEAGRRSPLFINPTHWMPVPKPPRASHE